MRTERVNAPNKRRGTKRRITRHHQISSPPPHQNPFTQTATGKREQQVKVKTRHKPERKISRFLPHSHKKTLKNIQKFLFVLPKTNIKRNLVRHIAPSKNHSRHLTGSIIYTNHKFLLFFLPSFGPPKSIIGGENGYPVCKILS